jgi:fructose-1,6-bisphosphatase/inositol monophosphatase family enzyme
MPDLHPLFAAILDMHGRIRDAVVDAARAPVEALSGVQRDDEGDTIYAIDTTAEDVTRECVDQLSQAHAFAFVAEGMPDTGAAPGRLRQGCGAPEWRIIHDPIDGTRGLMYQKRSAWILTGVAPNRGPSTSLGDIVFAVQTEIPLHKQHLSDQVWAVAGHGVTARRHDRLTGASAPLHLRPSSAATIAHGFATVSRFFPGARDELAAIDEEIVSGALGPVQPGKAHCFEDQYISTGGQLYELMAGHDRFIADLRPLAERTLAARGLKLGICCHPYDICTALIARELGVILTDAHGNALDAPLDLTSDVAWVGYANARIRAQVEPLLQAALRRREWL